MHFKVNSLPAYFTTTTYSIGSVIPHFRVKKCFFIKLIEVDNYPVIKLVPLDP